uniref:Uncharacterized protein n=1 Tax=Caudovirales sp. ctkvU4 TaxID=2826783 RepID=A0A8S5QPR7_9CAUD|nr:MAG TPA: hypothetical protein [Caudovirales sp. ctkvU4]
MVTLDTPDLTANSSCDKPNFNLSVLIFSPTCNHLTPFFLLSKLNLTIV